MTRLSTGFLLAALVAVPMMIPSASAQSLEDMFTVQGKVAESAYEITIPDGWRGQKSPAPTGSISGMLLLTEDYITTPIPEGSSFLDNTPEVLMKVVLIPYQYIYEVNLPSPEVGEGCDVRSASYVDMNGVTGRTMDIECPAVQSDSMAREHYVANVHEFYTEYATDYSKGHVVAITIIGKTQEAMDSRLADYSQLVDSLVLKQPGDMRDTYQSTAALKPAVTSVTVDESPVEIDMRSSSTVSDFKLDEPSKTLSFTVEGQAGTKGTTVLKIGSVLEGPYTATIDGRVATGNEFVVIEDPEGHNTAMLVYSHSVHEIAITGTQVVPEFPIASIGIVVATIGGIVAAGRMKYFRT